MARIKIIGQVFTSSHGVLKTGDVLTCSDEFAAHLINDVGAAEVLAVADEPAESVDNDAAADAPRRGRPPKK